MITDEIVEKASAAYIAKWTGSDPNAPSGGRISSCWRFALEAVAADIVALASHAVLAIVPPPAQEGGE